jgi:hypothetical protein
MPRQKGANATSQGKRASFLQFATFVPVCGFSFNVQAAQALFAVILARYPQWENVYILE